MRRISSSVRLTVAGSSAGSPTGSEPSGSSRAARWPCMRCALTRLVAAWTAWSSAASATGAAAGVAAAGGGAVERRGVGPRGGGGRGRGGDRLGSRHGGGTVLAADDAVQPERLQHSVVEAV